MKTRIKTKNQSSINRRARRSLMCGDAAPPSRCSSPALLIILAPKALTTIVSVTQGAVGDAVK